MQLYHPLHAKLCRFVQTLIWDKEEAKDIVSETILITFEQFDKIKDEKAILSYLFSVASNLVKKKINKKKFWSWLNTDEMADLKSAYGSENSLMLYELNQALQKLPVKQYEALTWFEISGLSIKEIAALHKMSEEGVKTNIHRARKKMALLLEHKADVNNTEILKGVGYEK